MEPTYSAFKVHEDVPEVDTKLVPQHGVLCDIDVLLVKYLDHAGLGRRRWEGHSACGGGGGGSVGGKWKHVNKCDYMHTEGLEGGGRVPWCLGPPPPQAIAPPFPPLPLLKTIFNYDTKRLRHLACIISNNPESNGYEI